jgi:hypothetical protein
LRGEISPVVEARRIVVEVEDLALRALGHVAQRRLDADARSDRRGGGRGDVLVGCGKSPTNSMALRPVSRWNQRQP